MTTAIPASVSSSEPRLIDLSFSRWSRLKDCPHSYKLRYIDKVPHPADNFYTIPGKVPGKQAEVFFRLPVDQRRIEFFADTFDQYWREMIANSTDIRHGNHVDWVGQGRRLAKKGKIENAELISTEEAFKLAFQVCKADTKVCSNALAVMISSHDLLSIEGETELQFELRIDPSDDPGSQPWAPSLKINGFIDLLIRRPDGVEIWDWKTTKYPDKLDLDQLLIYSTAVRVSGQEILKVGYLLIRQNRVDRRTVTPIMEFNLRKQLRQIGLYYQNDLWPANFREWKCEYCDVRHACSEAQSRLVSLRARR